MITSCKQPETLMSTGWFKSLRQCGFKFPDSYIVFDVETTGVKLDKDYIVQFGHLIVEDRVPRAPVATVLDWTRGPAALMDVKERIYAIQNEFRLKRRPYRFTWDVLANEGVDPRSVIDIYHTLFTQHQEAGGFLLTHNGCNFDTQIVRNHFKRFLNSDFVFDNSLMIDTGMLEKAVQLDMHMRLDETLPQFYARVGDFRAHTKWSLADHCVPKYRLAERFGLNMSEAHTAGFDCHVTHLLMEEHRRIFGED